MNKKVKFNGARCPFSTFVSPRWLPLRMRTKVVSFFTFSRAFKQKKLSLYDQRWLKQPQWGPAFKKRKECCLRNKWQLYEPKLRVNRLRVIWIRKLCESMRFDSGPEDFARGQQARLSKNAKFRSQARMFLTSGHALIVYVLVKLGVLHILLEGTFLKKVRSWLACCLRF